MSAWWCLKIDARHVSQGLCAVLKTRCVPTCFVIAFLMNDRHVGKTLCKQIKLKSNMNYQWIDWSISNHVCMTGCPAAWWQHAVIMHRACCSPMFQRCYFALLWAHHDDAIRCSKPSCKMGPIESQGRLQNSVIAAQKFLKNFFAALPKTASIVRLQRLKVAQCHRCKEDCVERHASTLEPKRCEHANDCS